MSTVDVLLSVNRDGTVASIDVKGASSSSVSEDIRSEIAGWLIAPARDGNETISQKKALELRVFCNAGFPGHPETATCFAQPWNRRIQPVVTVVTGGPSD